MKMLCQVDGAFSFSGGLFKRGVTMREDNEGRSVQPWVVIYTAGSPAEAYIVAGRLQNNGIQTQIREDTYGKITGISAGLHGAVEVLVSGADFEEAEAILSEDVSE